ncbi:hypothetical protein [Arthrobacter sp. YC-RL1]|uniref:hypothetical protein n=1 Tax=Arthrobacter sp. YC-RL1 TaxID=1652545 RepID=UPI000A447212|nr:hypothetical protein [Arthrobacter sp. YC-RL1]
MKEKFHLAEFRPDADCNGLRTTGCLHEKNPGCPNLSGTPAPGSRRALVGFGDIMEKLGLLTSIRV